MKYSQAGSSSLCALIISLLAPITSCLPSRARQATIVQSDVLLDAYDFIVVGAGTAGLTVADRLSESGEHTVLVVEYGFLDTSPSITYVVDPFRVVAPDPPDPADEMYSVATRMFNITAVPQAGLNGRVTDGLAGSVVGGSSAVNGMFFNRGTTEDYDGWVWAAGENCEPGYAAEWGWDNILPYFRKSCTFHPPSEEMVDQYGMTYDVEAAYGGTTPIHSSHPPYQFPHTLQVMEALKSIPGVNAPIEGAGGNATGVFWVPNSVDPADRTRSYSFLGHYQNEDGPSSRRNFHLLTAHRVTQVLMEREKHVHGRPGKWLAEAVAITPREGGMPDDGARLVKAKKEVIVSAGSLHTPQVLQRSGIGPRPVLEAANVDVKVDLPGVGANLQDHPFFKLAFKYSTRPFPTPADLQSNASFAAASKEEWVANRTGPYSSLPNIAALLPLSVISSHLNSTSLFQDLVQRVLSTNPASHLPANTDRSVLAGYTSQQQVLGRHLLGTQSATMEIPFGGDSDYNIILLKPQSRGTVHISPNDDGTTLSGLGAMEPVLDWRTFSHPIDMEICILMFKFLRSFATTTPVLTEQYGPITMTSPDPAEVRTDEEIANWIRNTVNPTDGHVVGTAALGPRRLGGVVGPDLCVHGTKGLSVADNSVMPLIPGAHTSSTAYAIGEKAADLVLRRHTTG